METTTTTTATMTAMRGEDGGGEGGMESFLATGESFTARGVNPARALTVGLTSTYMAINKRYYEVMETRRTLNEESPHVSPSRPGARVSETSTTEAEGANLSSPKRRASVNARDVVNERYLFDKILGRGSFGKVVLAYDLAEDKHVAVKVIERSERSDAAVDQIPNCYQLRARAGSSSRLAPSALRSGIAAATAREGRTGGADEDAEAASGAAAGSGSADEAVVGFIRTARTGGGRW